MAVSNWFWAIGNQQLAVGYWQLVIGYRLLISEIVVVQKASTYEVKMYLHDHSGKGETVTVRTDMRFVLQLISRVILFIFLLASELLSQAEYFVVVTVA